MLNIICIVNGDLEENCYIIHNKSYAMIIDPGSEANKIINKIGNLDVIGILITHYHYDHIGALDDIKNKYNGAKIFDYTSHNYNELECFKFKKINNFGHTMDSCSFLFENENIMFTGDFVFYRTIGNYDIENEEEMLKSLKNFIKLNDNIIIYPGHGPSSNIGYEKRNNYFLRGI